MIRVSRYFKLREQKYMKDGHFVEANQKLLYICSEENKMFVRTADDTNIVRLFWVSDEEVDFVEELTEEWSKEMLEYLDKETQGNWI